MYRYTLSICIISDNDYIENVLKEIEAKQGFEHKIYTISREEFSAEKDKSDIFVVDSYEDMLVQVYKAKKPDGVLVFYTEVVKKCQNFDRLWKKPATKDEMIFLFKNALQEIKLAKDNRLHLNYLETLIDNSPDLIWFKDINGSHVKVNESFCNAVNKTKAQVEGRGHYYIWDINPEEYSKGEYVCLESEEDVINAGKSLVFDENVKTKSGMRLFVTVKSPIYDENHQILGTVGMAHDVTELNNVSREMNLFIDNMPFGVIVSNEEDIVQNVNDEVLKMTGWTRKAMLGYKINAGLNFGQDFVSDNGDSQVAYITVPIKGEDRIFEMTKIHITDVFKNHIGIMRIFKDVTVERRLEAQVIHTANTDFLTGLYNRRYFYNYININCVNKPVAIVTADLDRFKSINDTYGHQTGDEALVLTSNVLKESFKDCVIVRIGGDEFIVIIESNDAGYIKTLVEGAYKNFQAAFKSRKEFANLGISVGVAFTDCLDGDVDVLVRKSDAALYTVKDNDKGGYFISEE